MAAQLTPERIAQLVKRPGTRVHVPTNLLPAKYKAMRLANQRKAQENATVYNPTAPLSGQDLRQAVGSIVDAQIKPQQDQLTTQRKEAVSGNQELARRMAGYLQFNEQSANLGLAGHRQVLDRMMGNLRETSAAARGSVTAADAAAQQRMGADQQLRGDGLDGGAQDRLAQEMAAQMGDVNARRQAMEVSGAEGGANAEGLGINLSRAAQLKGAESQQELALALSKQLRDNDQAQNTLGTQRAGLFSDTLMKMRDSEFEKAATSETLGLKTQAQALAEQKAATDRYNKKRQRGQADTRLEQGQARIDETKRHNLKAEQLRAMSTSGESMTPTQRRALKKANQKTRDDIDSWASLGKTVRGTVADFDGQKRKPNQHEVRTYILNKTKNKLKTDVAMDLIYKGYVSDFNKAALKDRGIGVPKTWIQQIKPAVQPFGGGDAIGGYGD